MVRESRANRRWTQGDLAKRLGILQQAISGWERGISRPENSEIAGSLAALFPERSIEEWLVACGYGTAEVRREPKLPVRPLLTTLPFHLLTYEQFQDFSAALLTEYHADSDVHQYGVSGDRQLGIDLKVTLADGSIYTFQCKRVQEKFGPAKVRQAIEDHRVDCDLAVLLLSKTATAAERDEIAKKRKKKWALWDAKDIADRIRSISDIQKQLRIIESFFPAYKKDFLGVEQPTVFESPEKYFAPFLKRSHVFSHAWSIVGREKELELVDAALGSPNGQLVLIVGPGGIGKTRFLREVIVRFSERHPEKEIVVLPSTATPLPQDYDLLSPSVGLIVVEDAHDRNDLKAVAHSLARLPPTIPSAPKLVVTCRPYAMSKAVSDLATAGYQISDDAQIKLAGLGVDQAEEVAREILLAKGGPVSAAHTIARVAHDSPLALVVGAHLVATKKIHPNALNNAEEFRQQLLSRFRDAVSGSIGLAADQPLIRATLEIVALLQPLDVEGQVFSDMAAKISNQPAREVKRAIQLLLEAGVLVRKARRLRIVPDLLGDYLVEEILLREGKNSPTVRLLLDLADGEQIGRLLVNTAKIDWRLNSSDESRSPLSNLVWSPLANMVDSILPEKLTEGIVTAAYYQPEQALSLYDHFLSAGNVPEEFSKLLRHVALNMEFLDRALQRLWAMAKADKRPENQYSNHPKRVLKELAQVELERPIAFCRRVAEFAMRKIVDDSALELYELLEEQLDPEIQATASSGLTISISRYTVRLDAVRELRRAIVDFLVGQLADGTRASAVRAALAMSSALRGPPNVSDATRAEWAGEFVETLAKIKSLLERGCLDSNALVAIEESVRWHIGYGEGRVRDAALEVVSAIPQTIDYRVTLSLVDAWGHTRMSAGDSAGWLERWKREQEQAASDLWAAFPSPDDLITILQTKLDAIREAPAKRNLSPGQFLGVVAEIGLVVSLAFCEAGLSTPGREVFFHAGFSSLMNQNPAEGVTIAKRAMTVGKVEFVRDVAWTLAARQLRSGALPSERELLIELSNHDDANVVASAIRGIVNSSVDNPAEILATLVNVDLGKSQIVASAFLHEVVNNEKLKDASLSPNVIEDVLGRIVGLGTIEDFWIEKYLAHVSEVSPVLLVEFLLERIQRATAESEDKIQPLPYLWDEKLPFSARKSPQYSEATRKVREWMIDAPDHWAATFWVPKLYVAIAGGVDELVARELLAWTENLDGARFDVVAMLLREATSRFVLENVALVAEFFERAEAIGSEAVRKLRGSLFSAAISGIRHGSPGQPFPEDVARKARSEEAIARLPVGSPVSEFYIGLAGDAERDIKRKKLDDEALFEQYE